MDVRLFLGVVRRFKWLLVASILLASALAILSYGMPTLAGGKLTLRPRGQLVWQSTAQVLMTQANFPYGQVSVSQGGIPGALASLTPVYAEFINGDTVQTAVHASGADLTVSASQVVDETTGTGLPILTVAATAPTAPQAIAASRLAVDLLTKYVVAQQTRTNVPPDNRVELQVVNSGKPAVLVSGHKLTLPMMVFVAVAAAGIALALILENLRPAAGAPRTQGAEQHQEAEAWLTSARPNGGQEQGERQLPAKVGTGGPSLVPDDEDLAEVSRRA